MVILALCSPRLRRYLLRRWRALMAREVEQAAAVARRITVDARRLSLG